MQRRGRVILATQEYDSLRYLTNIVYSEVSDQISIALLHSHTPNIPVSACDFVRRRAHPHLIYPYPLAILSVDEEFCTHRTG